MTWLNLNWRSLCSNKWIGSKRNMMNKIQEWSLLTPTIIFPKDSLSTRRRKLLRKSKKVDLGKQLSKWTKMISIRWVRDFKSRLKTLRVSRLPSKRLLIQISRESFRDMKLWRWMSKMLKRSWKNSKKLIIWKIKMSISLGSFQEITEGLMILGFRTTTELNELQSITRFKSINLKREYQS